MNLTARLFNFITSQVKEKFAEATLEDGSLINFEPAFEVGAEAMRVTENGFEPLADGDYITSEGQPFTVLSGQVASIDAAEEEEMNSDKFMEQAVLSDGTMVEANPSLAEGAQLVVMTPEGNAPAPDGDHQLEDGRIVTTVGGVITSIASPEEAEEEEEVMEEKRAPKTVIERTEVESKFAEANNKIEELTKALESATEKISEFEKSKSETEEMNKALAEMLEGFKETPKDQPKEKTNANPSKTDDRIFEFAQRLKSMKTKTKNK